MALPADQKQDPAALARIQQSLHLTDDQSAFLVRRAQWDTPQKRAFIEEFNKLPPAQKQDPATLQALGQRAGLSAAELDHMTQRINERFQQGWNGQGDWQWGRGRGRPADSAQAPANPSINNAALAASPPANNLTTDAPNITADDALAMSLAPPKFDWSTGGASPSVPLFGFTPFNVTYVPVTPIADPGFSNDPKMSTDNGVTAGNYNPTPKDTGGVTPSYSKPWYSSAWDATTGFVSNIWASLDNKPATPASTDPLAQANPTMLAANSPNTTKAVPGASAGAGGGGLA